jgi:restriction system protein
MTIPNYQIIMLPALSCLSDGEEHSMKSLRESLLTKFNLSDEDRVEMLPSGKQKTFDNRVHWARFYMLKAGLLEATKRGYIQITQRGMDSLSQNLDKIDNDYLSQFDEFNQFKNAKTSVGTMPKSGVKSGDTDVTPEESLEIAFQDLHNELKEELLKTVLNCSPSYFEHLVVDLLVGMGYGGSRKEAGKVMGQSGDEGIDGIINEDKLGLDVIYIQAKRWQEKSSVGRPEIQKFAGALQGKRAKKGIFITTTTFTKEAVKYVEQIESKIILIDGFRLTDYLIDNNVGVETVSSFDVKKINTDYFIEE